MLFFCDFCYTIQAIQRSSSTTKKVALFKEAFEKCDSNYTKALYTQFLGEGVFHTNEHKRIRLGRVTIGEAVSEFVGIDYDKVFKPSRYAVGSSSETAEKLVFNIRDNAEERTFDEKLLLEDFREKAFDLLQLKTKEEKKTFLKGLWEKQSAIEIRYGLGILTGRGLRIGFETKSIINALAFCLDKDVEQLRYAYMLKGNLFDLCIAALEDRLEEQQFSLFQPLSFMLASPIMEESRILEYEYVAEQKIDGMRCQLHADGEEVRLFSRDLNEISAAFPDVCAAFSQYNLDKTVLDGELVVQQASDKIGSFNDLQQRMGVKKPSKKVLSQFPVRFIAYDYLVKENQLLIQQPLEQRRAALEALAKAYPIQILEQFDIKDVKSLYQRFMEAKAAGTEGLVLKNKKSKYEYGKRGNQWMKLKGEGDSLDVVMLYAHAGSGKRGGLYSDFTFGVDVRTDERYKEEFIPIGKAYGGYTDADLKRINKELKRLTLQKFGPTLLLKPEIVIELEYEHIQQNKRTKAGFSLRFPRFKRIRWDKTIDQISSLKEVEKQFEAEQKHKIIKPHFSKIQTTQ